MPKTKLLNAKPTVTKVLSKKEQKPTLEEAQHFVGGMVALVETPEGQLICNEEGLLLKLPVNPLASQLARQIIVGNVLVLQGEAQWL